MIQRPSEHVQTRLRIPILLLGALLLTMLTISGLTLYALKGHRAELEKTLGESQEQALAFLANRLEQSLLNAVQNPFLILKNIPQEEIAEARLHLLRSTFPAVEEVLFLDRQMALIQSFPPPLNEHQGRFNQWIVQRLQEEEVNKEESQPFSLRTFVETISGQPALFAFQPINDIPSQDTNVQASNLSRDGWVLMRFNLRILRASRVAPLLAEFGQEQGGPVQLRDPEFAAGKDSV